VGCTHPSEERTIGGEGAPDRVTEVTQLRNGSGAGSQGRGRRTGPVLTFRRHHQPEPAWASATIPPEFRASGLELELIELVDLRDRSARAGFDDVDALDGRIAEVRDELARLGEGLGSAA
jgi:hypothetical protein